MISIRRLATETRSAKERTTDSLKILRSEKIDSYTRKLGLRVEAFQRRKLAARKADKRLSSDQNTIKSCQSNYCFKERLVSWLVAWLAAWFELRAYSMSDECKWALTRSSPVESEHLKVTRSY